MASQKTLTIELLNLQIYKTSFEACLKVNGLTLHQTHEKTK